MGAEERVLLAVLRALLPETAGLDAPVDPAQLARALGGEEWQTALDALWARLDGGRSGLPSLAARPGQPGFARCLARRLLALSYLGAKHPALGWPALRRALPAEAPDAARAAALQLLPAPRLLDESLGDESGRSSAAEPSDARLREQLSSAEALAAHYRAEAERQLCAAQQGAQLAKQTAFAEHRAAALERQLRAYERELGDCLARLKGCEQQLCDARAELGQARHEAALLRGEVECLRTTAARYNAVFAGKEAGAGLGMYAGEGLEAEAGRLCRALASELRACYGWMAEMAQLGG